MSIGRALLRRVLCAGLLFFTASLAFAWTDKPVRIVVPAPAGGAMDVIARMLGEQLSKDLGQPVIVDNRPGAGGSLGVQALLNAPADGQTIMIVSSGILTEIPHVIKVPFDPLKDVRAIHSIARVRNVLVSSPALPAQDFAGLVAYLEATPGKYSFASHSAGTVSHYAGLFLAHGEALDLQHVPFAGAPPALQQVMGGQVTLMFDSVITSLPLIGAGRLRAYGVGGSARHPNLPQVPTFVEIGHPELDFSNWYGVIASAKVPAALAERIHGAVRKAADASAVRDKMVALGFEPTPAQTPAELSQAMRSEFERNAAIVKKFDITP